MNFLNTIATKALAADLPAIVPKNSTSTDVESLFSNLVTILSVIAGILAFIYLVYSGILYLTAAGNPDAAKKGQQGLINAVIGIIIIVAAWAILNSVSGSASSWFS